MSEQALVAVIQEAWISGVSTRRVDNLVHAMELSGISKSTVSKLYKDIDELVSEFLNRALTREWPYVWLDATYLKQRQGGRIVSVAAIIAVAANSEGRREIIGLGVGLSHQTVVARIAIEFDASPPVAQRNGIDTQSGRGILRAVGSDDANLINKICP